MSKKAKQYSATEKTKIVIEAIKAEMTIAQIGPVLRMRAFGTLGLKIVSI